MKRKKIVLKLGTSTLTAGSTHISYGKLEDIARQLLALRDTYDIIVVSSGAIATAKQFVSLQGNGNTVELKQALSAIGQPKLMSMYDEVFEKFGLHMAQCLLTNRDIDHDVSRTNIKNTLDVLLANGYTPIINENDTVAIEEIMFGDNDALAAHVAVIAEADLVVLASDVDGLYDRNIHIDKDAILITEVSDLQSVESYIGESTTTLGTGGMRSKLKSVEICRNAGIEVWIVNGQKQNFLVDALEHKIQFTTFTTT